MEYCSLGCSGLMVSRLAFGCAAMSGFDYGAVDDRESERAVHRAIELGVNFFDTADVYGLGHAEEVLGRALRPYAVRSDILVATKFGVRWDAHGQTEHDLSPRRVRQAVEGSLRRLQLDCIPLYQIHWPDERVPIAQTLEALRECQERQQIAVIGCCNFSAALVEEAQQFGRLESLQLPFSLAQGGNEATFCSAMKERHMATLAYNVLAQGLLTGKYSRDSTFEGTDLRQRSDLFRGAMFERNLNLLQRVRAVAMRRGKTPAQVAIRWALDSPWLSCAITGVKRVEQIEENVGAMDWILSEEDWQFLSTDEGQSEGTAR